MNYDLPWNPQRVEQRIGRCHRYGQKHEVVVVKFIIARTRRTSGSTSFFRRCSGSSRAFSAPATKSWARSSPASIFEKRIAGIYQECRQPEQIRAAFDQLQLELSLEIDTAMSQTRQNLLEKFDDEVREKLRVRDEDAKIHLDRYEQWF